MKSGNALRFCKIIPDSADGAESLGRGNLSWEIPLTFCLTVCVRTASKFWLFITAPGNGRRSFQNKPNEAEAWRYVKTCQKNIGGLPTELELAIKK
jgi:hypothetical protein